MSLAGCQSTSPPSGLTAEQIAVLKAQGFRPNDEGWVFDLSGKVLFGSDVGAVNKQSREIVERIGKALMGVGIDHLRVDGHADASGKATYNEQLSLLRAKSVSDALVAIGMRQENLQIRGLGSNYPVAPNNTAEGRTENRRVAIVVASH
ncbi:OmpA family protein [Pseudomonas sp. PB3P13]